MLYLGKEQAQAEGGDKITQSTVLSMFAFDCIPISI